MEFPEEIAWPYKFCHHQQHDAVSVHVKKTESVEVPALIVEYLSAENILINVSYAYIAPIVNEFDSNHQAVIIDFATLFSAIVCLYVGHLF